MATPCICTTTYTLKSAYLISHYSELNCHTRKTANYLEISCPVNVNTVLRKPVTFVPNCERQINSPCSTDSSFFPRKMNTSWNNQITNNVIPNINFLSFYCFCLLTVSVMSRNFKKLFAFSRLCSFSSWKENNQKRKQ